MVLTSFTSSFVIEGNAFVFIQGCFYSVFLEWRVMKHWYHALQIYFAIKGWFCLTRIGSEHNSRGKKKISLLTWWSKLKLEAFKRCEQNCMQCNKKKIWLHFPNITAQRLQDFSFFWIKIAFSSVKSWHSSPCSSTKKVDLLLSQTIRMTFESRTVILINCKTEHYRKEKLD